MIVLYDKATNAKLALLDDIIIDDSMSITRQINGEFTFKFEALESDLKSEYFEGNNYVLVDGFYFDIVYIEQIHVEALTYGIECEHISYRLIADDVPYYTFDGTPAQILADILSDTEFQVGQVDSTDILTFAVHEETNKLGLIKRLANTIGAEIGYDGFKIDLKNTVGQDRGYIARFGKNITGVKKIIDKRSNLTYYSVDIIELKNHPDFLDVVALEIVEEGDAIRIVDELMGLDVTNKVIKRTYNPVKAINTALEIANNIELLTDTVTRIQRETVTKDKLYYGIRISPENGFESIRSDNKARGVFNSDIFALQTGDGTGNTWTNKLYFDPVSGNYIFDGTLTASAIEAITASIDVTVSNTVIVNNLYAARGNITELTVDQLDSSDKVAKYLASDTSDVNYIKIYDQHLDFISASTNGATTVQATDREGTPLYWIDGEHAATTTNVTDFPVTIYQYTEAIKMSINFELVNGVYEPKIVLGIGDGTGDKHGTAEIYKETTGVVINYYKSITGDLRQLELSDAGITVTGNTGEVGLRNVYISATAPANPQLNDLWIDTDA